MIIRDLHVNHINPATYEKCMSQRETEAPDRCFILNHGLISTWETREQPVLRRAALVKSLLLRTAIGKQGLWPYSEDAPQSAIELEGLLSPIEIVTGYATRTAGTIHRNHFIVRSRSDSVRGPLEL